MKLMLTSFGITEEMGDLPKDLSIFYLMPPVYMRKFKKTFIPNYAALFLCEKVIIDESSFSRLIKNPHWLYAVVSEAFKALHREGFIELVSFKNILESNKALLSRMLKHDLKTLDQWIEPFKESLEIWDRFRSFIQRQNGNEIIRVKIPRDAQRAIFIQNMLHALSPDYHREAQKLWMVYEALFSSRKRRKQEYREALYDVLRSYLTYVNANIVISNELGVGFHDWMDFLPFYQQKFLSVGHEDVETEHHVQESQKLFEVVFPEFAITDINRFTASLLKALRDKRIEGLRKLVQDAVDGKVIFDESFANNVLKEVLDTEWRIRKYIKIISYLTVPIGFIPWIGTLAQKAIEEAIETPLENKLRKQYQWFYLLSDVVKESREYGE